MLRRVLGAKRVMCCRLSISTRPRSAAGSPSPQPVAPITRQHRGGAKRIGYLRKDARKDARTNQNAEVRTRMLWAEPDPFFQHIPFKS